MKIITSYAIVLLVATITTSIPSAVYAHSLRKEIQAPKDSSALVQKVIQFLKWYKQNYSKARDFEFIKTDAKGNYQVNLNDCKRYLDTLKSSGCISGSYIKDWQKYFDDKAAYLAENPQNEGPPEGFDYDLVLITQEPELVLDNIRKLKYKVLKCTSTKATVGVTGKFGVDYEFEMSKSGKVWLIDYISTMNYD